MHSGSYGVKTTKAFLPIFTTTIMHIRGKTKRWNEDCIWDDTDKKSPTWNITTKIDAEMYLFYTAYCIFINDTAIY